MKSITCPSRNRSMTLPSAPPKISATAQASTLALRSMRLSHSVSTMLTISARALNNQRPDLPANLPEQGDCSNYSNAPVGSQTRDRHIRQEFIREPPTSPLLALHPAHRSTKMSDP